MKHDETPAEQKLRTAKVVRMVPLEGSSRGRPAPRFPSEVLTWEGETWRAGDQVASKLFPEQVGRVLEFMSANIVRVVWGASSGKRSTEFIPNLVNLSLPRKGKRL